MTTDTDQPKPSQAVAAKPTPSGEIMDIQRIGKFEDFIAHPSVQKRLRAVLPNYLTPDRVVRVLALAAFKNPKIREVAPMSLLGSLMTVSSLAFEPNTPLGHAYLIPFDVYGYNREKQQREVIRTDVNLIVGYPGMMDLVRRTGMLVAMRASIVHKGDEFSFEYGSNMHLKHRPVGLVGDRPATYAYSEARLTDGYSFEVLPYEEAVSFRRYSQAFQTALRGKEEAERDKSKAWKAKGYDETPWVKHEGPMAMKTMIRRHCTFLPKSIQFASQLHVETMAETGKIDFEALGSLDTDDAKARIESGMIPEREAAEVSNGDTPDQRPERDEARKTRSKAPSQSARVVESTATEVKQDGSGTVSDTVGKKAEPEDRHPNAPPLDAEPQERQPVSAELKNALDALKSLRKPEEIEGARQVVRDELSKEDYAVWAQAAAERAGELAKHHK